MKARLVHFSPVEDARHRERAEALVLPPAREMAALLERLGVRGVANEWLLAQSWKRSLAMMLYGDLLMDGPSRDVLDVGAGLSGLAVALASRHRYRALEKATHESPEDYHRIESHLGRLLFTIGDWADDNDGEPLDLVVANDLFPNVDQRLYEFTDAYLPRIQELRLSLTYYEGTAWEVTRAGSGERLIVRPWGLRDVTRYVEDLASTYGVEVPAGDRAALHYEDYRGTLFSNCRNIVCVTIVR